ncbi:hypothetical protein DsansV1_C07g0071921 [Dioscorea sansibarensis]
MMRQVEEGILVLRCVEDDGMERNVIVDVVVDLSKTQMPCPHLSRPAWINERQLIISVSIPVAMST